MYANPKSKFGQALYMIFNAIAVCWTVIYPLLMLAFPFAPNSQHNHGVEFPPPLLSLLIFSVTLVNYTAIVTFLFFIKRLIQITTSKGTSKIIYHFINILHITSVALTTLSILSMTLALPIKIYESTSRLYFPLAALALMLILFFLHKAEKKRNGAQKPYFMSKQKVFTTVVAIIAVVAILFVPMNTNKNGYEDDPSGNIYHRTNAFAYSIIEVEDKVTHEMSEPKIFFFPKNYEHTGKLFGFR